MLNLSEGHANFDMSEKIEISGTNTNFFSSTTIYLTVATTKK